jgi:hypothetical protein
VLGNRFTQTQSDQSGVTEKHFLRGRVTPRLKENIDTKGLRSGAANEVTESDYRVRESLLRTSASTAVLSIGSCLPTKRPDLKPS